MEALDLLLHRAADGDEEAFATLYYTYRRPVLYHLRRLCKGVLRQREPSDDLVEAVFVALVRFFRDHGRLATGMQLSAWLRRTAEHVVSDRRRYWNATVRKPEGEVPLSDSWESRIGLVDPARSPSSEAALRDQVCVLDRAIEELPEAQRRVIELKRRGHETAEIAALLQVTTHTIQHHSARALARLGRRLGAPS